MENKGTAGTTEIRLKVDKEENLYNPLNPESEFSYGVKNYLRTQMTRAGYKTSFRLRVLSSTAMDEEKFREASANWMREEKSLLRQEAKQSNRMLMGMLLIASFFIILSLSLTKHISVLSYTIIPVLGSVALGRAAGICLTDLPINTAKRNMIDEMESQNNIIFEYAEDPGAAAGNH